MNKEIEELHDFILNNLFEGTTYLLAEKLYNAGYRKTFTSEFASPEQKAFKEDYAKGYDEGESEVARLKDELGRYAKMFDDGIVVTKEWHDKEVRQAVKNTAQTALEKFICRLVNARLVGVNDDLYVELLETKDDLLKEKYGVEVE